MGTWSFIIFSIKGQLSNTSYNQWHAKRLSRYQELSLITKNTKLFVLQVGSNRYFSYCAVFLE